jgi:hypothetical protein
VDSSTPPLAAAIVARSTVEDFSWVVNFTANSLAVAISLRMASLIADVTNVATETGTMNTAKQIATIQYDRTVRRVSTVLAFRLSALTGLSCADSLVRATRRLAGIFSFHSSLPAALACKMLLRVVSSTSTPVSAA